MRLRQSPFANAYCRFCKATSLTWYEYRIILICRRIGERGQVTIRGSIILKKAPKKLNLAKWKGRCGDTFAKLGYSSLNKFIDDVRGR